MGLFDFLSGLFGGSDDGSLGEVQIGDQIWTARNLQDVTPNSRVYQDNDALQKRAGRLYHWDEALACTPEGWRLPRVGDFHDLSEYLKGQGVEDVEEALREGGSTGFNVVMGGTYGLRFGETERGFSGAGSLIFLWTADEDETDKDCRYVCAIGTQTGFITYDEITFEGSGSMCYVRYIKNQ